MVCMGEAGRVQGECATPGDTGYSPMHNCGERWTMATDISVEASQCNLHSCIHADLSIVVGKGGQLLTFKMT